jgi:aerobic carbon-monoxide dehydrogenase medium subunit
MITEYLLPDSAEQAVAELASGAAVMAGGTTLMPAAQAGALAAERVVGLARAGLGGIDRRDGRTVLGATVPLAAVAGLEDVPALADAAAAVGGPALRNMATVGGNLLAGLPYGDVAVALLALDAEVRLSGRSVPIERFWDEFRAGEEIVLGVAFDDEPDSVFIRWARRAANSPAVVCVAVSGGRVALGGVAPHPVRSPGAEAALDDPAAAGAAAASEVDPPTDAIASAWYRKRMTELFVRRALEESHGV